MGGNPYARFLKSRVGSYRQRSPSVRESQGLDGAFDPLDQSAFLELCSGLDARPILEHRASMPHVFAVPDIHRRASVPSLRISDPSRTYALSSRPVPGPIPGPLPAPNFSFGPPADSPLGSSPLCDNNKAENTDYISHHQTQVSPGLDQFTFGRTADDNDIDGEDDITTTSTSYDAMSRFGSIASITGSESSNTSAYYSDVGSCCNELPPPADWNPDARRASL